MKQKDKQATHEVEPMQFKSLRDLYAEPQEETRYVVEGLLPVSGLSVLAGKPKAGKSTLARQLVAAVAKGEPFLGRETEKGKVMYVSLEEKTAEVARHFIDLGLTGDEQVWIYCEPAPGKAIPALERALQDNPDVQLVVIDPIFRFIKIKDGNDYAAVYEALQPLLEMARCRSAHILTIHHRKKKMSDDSMDDVLGSTAITGAVDTVLMLSTKGEQRLMQSRQRYGTNMEETLLEWNPDRRALSLGMTAEQAVLNSQLEIEQRIERDIMEYLIHHPESTKDDIFESIKGKSLTKHTVFTKLMNADCLTRNGDGTRGSPYRYSYHEVPTEDVSTSPEPLLVADCPESVPTEF